EGTLDAQGIEDLKTLLRQPDARAALIADLQLHASLRDFCRLQPAAPSAAAERVSTGPRWAIHGFLWPIWRSLGIVQPALACAARAVCLLLLAFLVWPWPALPRLTEFSGQVIIERRTAKVSVTRGVRLSAEDVLKVGPGAAATIQWSREATSLQLGENTE